MIRNGDMGPFVVYVYPNNRDSTIHTHTIHPMLIISRIIAKAGNSRHSGNKKDCGKGKILVIVK